MSATPLPLWADVLVSLLLVVGTAAVLLGSWALAKWGDFFNRLHGPSKATTLGVGCMLAASALFAAVQGTASGRELVLALFLAVTAPVSAQLLVWAAMKRDRQLPPPPPSGAAPAAETESPPPPA